MRSRGTSWLLAFTVIHFWIELPKRLKEESHDHIISLRPRERTSPDSGVFEGMVRRCASFHPRPGEAHGVMRMCVGLAIRNCHEGITGMRHILNGVAIAAALAFAAPVWAQQGGNSMGVPGPSPGGPGLTPYSTGAPPAAAAPGAPMAPMPPAESSANPATPGPHHLHKERAAYHHAKAMRNFHRGMAHKAAQTGDTTAALNREELARIQGGNMSNPPPPPPPSGPMSPPSEGMPGPKTSGASGAGPRP
jgi:hypothetical protein